MTSPCQCSPDLQGIAYCERHRCEKTEHWRMLCRTDAGYCALWDADAGPGQLYGLRCSHRSVPEKCSLCASNHPVTPIDQRPGTREFGIGDATFSIREGGDDLCVWPSGVILADLVNDPPRRIVHETAIDIGCGTGIVGLAALHAGYHVAFLDREQSAVELAVENAEANLFSDADFDFIIADWKDPQPGRTWDNVFASEVLWSLEDRPHFLRWLALHWSLKGVCWIAHSGEPIPEQLFIDAAFMVRSERNELVDHPYGTVIYEVTAT